MDISQKLAQALGEGLSEHELLKNHTLLKVGGVADFFYQARKIEDLITAARLACELKLPYLILGGGSQIMVSDYGFPGLVIHNLTSNISFILEQSQVLVDSGVTTARLVMEAASRDLGGMESFVSLPGTIGSAVYSNQGNFGFTMASLVKTVTVFIPPNKIATYKGEWLRAGYLTTKLKNTKTKDGYPPIILAVKLQLQHYKSQEIVRKIAYWQKLLKPGFALFKNPSSQPVKLGDDPDIIARSATEVLKRLQAHRLRIGHASLDPQDPNRLVNKGKATASQMRQLVEKLKTTAAEQAGVRLEEGFEYVGKWE